MARVGQMLAFAAVFLLAVNPHPLHAQPGDGAGHGHFGSFCEAFGTEKSPSDGEENPSSSHGDCIHHFDTLVRASIGQGRGYVAIARPLPYFEMARQQNFGFDPPPPRFPS